jgi:hypothetical protein
MKEYFNLTRSIELRDIDLLGWRMLRKGLSRLKQGISTALTGALEMLKNPQDLTSNVPTPFGLFDKMIGNSSEGSSSNKMPSSMGGSGASGASSPSKKPSFGGASNNILPTGNLPKSSSQSNPQQAQAQRSAQDNERLRRLMQQQQTQQQQQQLQAAQRQ